MKVLSISVLLSVVCLSVAFTLPEVETPEEQSQKEFEIGQLEVVDNPQVEARGRFKRATCDLLSFTSKWLTVNHAACAAHCISMRKGYKGGYCKKTICHCRK